MTTRNSTPEMPSIPDEVFAYFASNPIGTIIEVPRVADEPESPIYESLNSHLDQLPIEGLSGVLTDPQFLFFNSEATDINRAARIWYVSYALMGEIARRRNQLLRAEHRGVRPRPYETEALIDMAVDEEGLVPLREFRFDRTRLLRNQHAYTVLCTAPSPNATYWLLQAIYDVDIQDQTKVRVDPFLHGPKEAFPSIFYKMWMYGRPIDWERIAQLKEPEHGRWCPDNPVPDHGLTEFVWDPRGGEVHLAMEEVPPLTSEALASGRYLHAVYSPSLDALTHLDGALRLYNQDELRERRTIHVRHSGKVGVRRKVFRVDATISRDTLSILAQTFFVWNQDVGRYFETGAR